MNEGIITETLIERFCRRKGCPRDSAERRLLLECIAAWKRGAWVLIERISPTAFENDWDAIKEAAHSKSLQEVINIVETFRYRGRSNPSFWRRNFNLRISGRRLQEIAKCCFKAG